MTRRPSFARRDRAHAAPGQTIAASSGRIWVALGSVYLIWGSTYLAIREAVRTLPPFLMASARFLVAGLILYVWAIRRGEPEARAADRPGRRQWGAAFVAGGLLLLIGNGGVTWSERRIPTGVAALLVATVPLWMAVLDRLWFGQRLPRPAVMGLALGFGGLVLLVGAPGGHIDKLGAGAVLVGALGWATGSLYLRSAPLPQRPLVATAMEMIGGGILLGLAGIALGEPGQLHLAHVSLGSWLGLAYLVVFGSWVGFVAYVWLLRAAHISLVSTYAYVNPVVAVFLGWVFLDEVLTGRTFLAAAVIVLAVALIITARRMPAGDAAGGVDSEAGRRA